MGFIGELHYWTLMREILPHWQARLDDVQSYKEEWNALMYLLILRKHLALLLTEELIDSKIASILRYFGMVLGHLDQ